MKFLEYDICVTDDKELLLVGLADGSQLFVRKVRNNKYKEITEEQKKLLTEINFPWSNNRGYEKKFVMFKEYCQDIKKNPELKISNELFDWVDYMRDRMKKGLLEENIIKDFLKCNFDLNKTFSQNGWKVGNSRNRRKSRIKKGLDSK